GRQPRGIVKVIRVSRERAEQNIGLQSLSLNNEDGSRSDLLLLRRVQVDFFLRLEVRGDQGGAAGQARQRVEIAKQRLLIGDLASGSLNDAGLRGSATCGERRT